jgi:4-amino-4-deoxy-L-arabinose transferase-like glycosyltransferase
MPEAAMDALSVGLLLVGTVTLAVALDVIVVMGWRRHRQGRPFLPPGLAARLTALRRCWRAAATAVGATRREIGALAREIRSDEMRLLRASLILACLIVSAGLGYANVQSHWVPAWVPAAWLTGIVVAAAALAPQRAPSFALARPDLLLLIPLALGLIVRAFEVGSIPSGLHTDETTTANFALTYIAPSGQGTYYPLRPGPDTQPVLYYHLVYGALKLFGESTAALRAPSVAAGVLAILATYALVAAWQDRRTALMAALLMSTYHYHVHWSRVALNNIWDTVWVPVILAAAAWGWKRNWSGGALLAGLALGFSQYFYVGSRVALLLVPCALYLLWKEDGDRRRLVLHSAKILAAAAVVALPLALFSIANPEHVLGRARMNYTWIPAELARQGTTPWTFLQAVVRQAWNTLAGLIVLPDTSAFYGPGIPFLPNLAGICFVGAIVWALSRRRFLPLAWVATTLFFAAFLIPGPPHSSHIIAAVPALMWLVAMVLADLARLGRPRLAWCLLALLMLTDLTAYIVIMGGGGGDPAFSVPFPFPPTPTP